MNVAEVIKQVTKTLSASNLFYGHGTDNPDDEAFALVLSVLELSFDDPAVYEKEVDAESFSRILSLTNERIQTHKPLPYLTHTAYFAGLPFYIDERVIVPRSPFAEIIENHFSPWIKSEDINSVLDLCTGSGCMAIATAIHIPNVVVDAVELSEDALAVAQKNVALHHVADRVNLLQSDLFQAIPAEKKYDVIISNPPYVSHEEMASLPKEFHHEPNMALAAEDEGLAIVLKILKEAAAHLNDHGVLFVEVGNSQAALEKRLPNLPFIWLEFEMGGEGIFILKKEELLN